MRRNPALCRALRQRFGMEIRVPAHHEEAACGAALSAVGALCGEEAGARARHLIRYLEETDCAGDMRENRA